MAAAKCSPISFQRNRVSALTIDAALDLKRLSQRDQDRVRRGLSYATTSPMRWSKQPTCARRRRAALASSRRDGCG
jgi:hypothetical protein